MENVLCAANAVNMKYFFNEEKYGILPERIKKELKVILVSYCSDVGGTIVFSYSEDKKLLITTMEPVDDIGSEIKIKEMQKKNSELFAQLELFAENFV